MNTLYRKVLCSERLPEKSGEYISGNDAGVFQYGYFHERGFKIKGIWHNEMEAICGWWLEEVNIPDEEYVEKFIIELQKHFKMKFDVETWKSGFRIALELLTGGRS